MQLETLQFHPSQGWSADFPEWDGPDTLVVTFGASSFLDDAQPLVVLHKTFAESHHIGCSTSGEIFGDMVSDGGLSVAIVRFDKTKVRTAISQVSTPESSLVCGHALAAQLADPQLRGVFVLSDGLKVNGSELVRGLTSELPKDVVVTGGLAGDGDKFQRTWSLAEGLPQEGLVTAVGLYGDHVRIGHGSKGGWDIFGPERTITKSEGNVLYEIDGRPALELYKEYLGERAEGLPATGLLFPLSLRESEDSTKSLVRTILAVDEDHQSMTFAGDIPTGHRVQLMHANFDRLVDGAFGAAEMTEQAGPAGGDVLSIAISCVGRRLVLGERTEEEVEATLDVLPEGTQQIGFYSYGEISPYASGSCDLHNQTMTLTTISES